jgi:ferritin-like metal-binding protein YciE
MAAPKSAEDILITELKEIYSAEKQLARMIPKALKNVSSERLRELLEERRDRGASLMEDVEAALEELNASKSRPKNVAAEGLVEDVNEHIESIDDGRMLDAVLLASMQKIEHYCIAAWGTAAALGRLLRIKSVTQPMERALDEGKHLDEELTALAVEEINPAMLEGEEEEEEKEKPRARGRRVKA